MGTRIVFYCHNVFGLGHVTRSARIARAALDRGAESCALATGCRSVGELDLDPRIEVEPLPALRFADGVRAEAVDPELAGVDIVRLRGERILSFVRRYRPTVLVADHLPLGLAGELMDTLATAHRESWQLRFVWGIPYSEGGVPDSRRPGNPRIRTAFGAYETAIAYTDPRWDDPFVVCPSWALPPRRAHVGFVAPPPPQVRPPASPRVVALCGGGFQAATMHERVLSAFRLLRDRDDAEFGSAVLRLVVGPLAAGGEVEAMVAGDPTVEVWPSGSTEEAIRDASLVVSRVGYNSSFSLLQTSLPLVLLPLPRDGSDQHRRAARMAELPAVQVLDERRPTIRTDLVDSLVRGLAAGCEDRGLDLCLDGAAGTARMILGEA